jgi:hypothetical protein
MTKNLKITKFENIFSVLWICFGFSANLYPAFLINTDPNQDFDDQKFKNNKI